MSKNPLVMDVGMYDGSDTAYYLKLGYRVVAIDANPEMIDAAKSRFFDAVNNGQLTLINMAIAQHTGSSTLFVCNRDKGSSRLNRQTLDDRGEDSLEAVEVPCNPFYTVLEKFGTPYYLKIDIEGSDRLCLEAIAPESLPTYVSWEAGEDAIECLNIMYNKGYRKFKIINQMTFYDVPTINTFKYRVGRKLRDIFGLSGPLYNPHQDWTFIKGHSAGPCCDDTSGLWRSLEETVSTWKNFCQNKTSLFDIHATLPL